MSPTRQGITSPQNNPARNGTNPVEEEKIAEDKAEEKKKMDMMRKFYRNRYSSFLQALTKQKSEKEEQEKAIKEAAEKKKQKVTQKALGDVSRVRSKIFDTNTQAREKNHDDDQQESSGAMMQVKDFNATSKSTASVVPRSQSKQARTIKRGNSISSLSAAEKAYNDSSTNVSSG